MVLVIKVLKNRLYYKIRKQGSEFCIWALGIHGASSATRRLIFLNQSVFLWIYTTYNYKYVSLLKETEGGIF
jgi:hypothetical protein